MFALSALTLAVVGLYGALGVVVRQRQREIGIRLALGAAVGEIRRIALKQGMRPAAGVLKTPLFGIEPRDPLTFFASTLVIGVAVPSPVYFPRRVLRASIRPRRFANDGEAGP